MSADEGVARKWNNHCISWQKHHKTSHRVDSSCRCCPRDGNARPPSVLTFPKILLCAQRGGRGVHQNQFYHKHCLMLNVFVDDNAER